MNIKKLISITLCLLLTISAYSQQQDATVQVLDKYGKQKGAVLVQLSEDVLSEGNSKMILYKSLIVDKIEDSRRDEILGELSANLNHWQSLSEVKKQGIIESVTYCIEGKDGASSQYLLIRNNKKQLTIVYIQGKFPPKQLQYELQKLKDLFIYINDKRIKIG